MDEITLKLNAQQINIIMQGLENLPLKLSGGVYSAIQKQIREYQETNGGSAEVPTPPPADVPAE